MLLASWKVLKIFVTKRVGTLMLPLGHYLVINVVIVTALLLLFLVLL